MSADDLQIDNAICPEVPKEGERPPASNRNSSKLCYNCMETGHIARDCKNPRAEGDARERINKDRARYRKCFNCGKMGHMSADCTKPAGNKSCYNCGGEGHIAKECPNPKSSGE
mmetsp:Transcript_8302/g.23897  ORF Transcript_8302/g.23897 Transcript_8302/m.23897 type:complete len:114 (-) Transcript_8302:699-1040(-)